MKQDTRSGRWLRHVARCLAAAALLAFGAPAEASDADRAHVELIVGEAIRPVMAEHAIPGMAVAVTVRGQRHVFHYGVASRESGRPVTDATLFEIGSVSKTMTALLAVYAQASGRLSLSDPASRHLPALAGSRLDRVSLLDLGTYTAGGLPLQFPAGVRDEAGMVAYLKGWRPAYEPGTHRVYSNPSLGLFGHLAARAMGEPFTALMEGRLFPALGLSRAYIRVPRERMDDYAQGYNRENRPTRVSPGMFDAEAYGVKTTASDLIRFVEANMDGSVRDEALRRAIRATQAAHYRVGPMMQGVGWEMLPEPVDLAALVATTSLDFALTPARAERLDPPLPPRPDLWLHKTGSTAGFGAYAAFVPARNVGIVMLANRAYPNAARVTAAHRILAALGSPR